MPSQDQKYVPAEYSDGNLKMADSAIQELVNWTEQLSQKTRELPKVDKDGKSECPYAERLYAEKNELLERVNEKRNTVLQYKGVVDQIISKHRRNLDIIVTDANKIHTRKNKDGYSLAAVSQEYVLKKAIDQRKAIVDALAWSEKIIQAAKFAKYPGKRPEKKFIPPARQPQENPSHYKNLAKTPESSGLIPETGKLDNEIENLFSMGPLPPGGLKI